jgi:hypothetical protein
VSVLWFCSFCEGLPVDIEHALRFGPACLLYVLLVTGSAEYCFSGLGQFLRVVYML